MPTIQDFKNFFQGGIHYQVVATRNEEGAITGLQQGLSRKTKWFEKVWDFLTRDYTKEDIAAVRNVLVEAIAQEYGPGPGSVVRKYIHASYGTLSPLTTHCVMECEALALELKDQQRKAFTGELLPDPHIPEARQFSKDTCAPWIKAAIDGAINEWEIPKNDTIDQDFWLQIKSQAVEWMAREDKSFLIEKIYKKLLTSFQEKDAWSFPTQEEIQTQIEGLVKGHIQEISQCVEFITGNDFDLRRLRNALLDCSSGEMGVLLEAMQQKIQSELKSSEEPLQNKNKWLAIKEPCIEAIRVFFVLRQEIANSLDDPSERVSLLTQCFDYRMASQVFQNAKAMNQADRFQHGTPPYIQAQVSEIVQKAVRSFQQATEAEYHRRARITFILGEAFQNSISEKMQEWQGQNLGRLNGLFIAWWDTHGEECKERITQKLLIGILENTGSEHVEEAREFFKEIDQQRDQEVALLAASAQQCFEEIEKGLSGDSVLEGIAYYSDIRALGKELAQCTGEELNCILQAMQDSHSQNGSWDTARILQAFLVTHNTLRKSGRAEFFTLFFDYSRVQRLEPSGIHPILWGRGKEQVQKVWELKETLVKRKVFAELSPQELANLIHTLIQLAEDLATFPQIDSLEDLSAESLRNFALDIYWKASKYAGGKAERLTRCVGGLTPQNFLLYKTSNKSISESDPIVIEGEKSPKQLYETAVEDSIRPLIPRDLDVFSLCKNGKNTLASFQWRILSLAKQLEQIKKNHSDFPAWILSSDLERLEREIKGYGHPEETEGLLLGIYQLQPRVNEREQQFWISQQVLYKNGKANFHLNEEERSAIKKLFEIKYHLQHTGRLEKKMDYWRGIDEILTDSLSEAERLSLDEIQETLTAAGKRLSPWEGKAEYLRSKLIEIKSLLHKNAQLKNKVKDGSIIIENS